jgi:hypothetical protein
MHDQMNVKSHMEYLELRKLNYFLRAGAGRDGIPWCKVSGILALNI